MATALVLLVDMEARDRPGWGTVLWWVTKTTPAIMAPCLVWIALLEHDRMLVWLFLAFGVFVIVAVPLAIRQRQRRIRASAQLLRAHNLPVG